MEIFRKSYSVIVFIYSIPTLLSLIDIYHQREPDLSNEWVIVVIFLFMIYGLLVLNFVQKKKKKQG